MYKIVILTVFLFIFSGSYGQKTYVKKYYPNGNLKEEGWSLNNERDAYWFFYNENGTKNAEGHYADNQKCNWWIFYDENGKVIKKSEFSNNKLDGFTIIYKKSKVIRAEKYSMNKKTKEWETISAFKKDNPFLFL